MAFSGAAGAKHVGTTRLQTQTKNPAELPQALFHSRHGSLLLQSLIGMITGPLLHDAKGA